MVPLEKVEEELHTSSGHGTRRRRHRDPGREEGERLVVLHLPLNARRRELCEDSATRAAEPLRAGPRDFFQVAELPILGSGKLDLKKRREKAQELADEARLAG